MQLNTTSVTYHQIGHEDLEAFAEAHYGRRYSAVSGLWAVSEAHYSATASPTHRGTGPDGRPAERPGLGPEDRAALTAWLSGHGHYPPPAVLLSDLALRGVIPAGEYLIHVSR
ncbi:hypothetical protein [Streptomyces sp. NPDC001889]